MERVVCYDRKLAATALRKVGGVSMDSRDLLQKFEDF